MLVRQKIQRAISRHPGESARELARRLHMSDGPVAGHLNKMEKAGFVTRSHDSEGVSRWWAASTDDPMYAWVPYIGNNNYRIYLKDQDAEIADRMVVILRAVVPELKFARVFKDHVRANVERNKLIKLKGNN